MCAILGAYLDRPSSSQLLTLKRIFLESQVRGRHATGFTVLLDGKLWTHKQPVPAEEFVETVDWSTLKSLDTLALIGHCRYSTSDLQYNQPIQHSDELSLVHNGVVTQDPPEQWGRFGYDLETSNDSELLWRSVSAGKEPLLEFPDASLAVAELNSSGQFRWYRNGKRPLYHTKVKNGYFLTSTRDIAERSGLKGSVLSLPGVLYTPEGEAKIVKTPEIIAC